MSVIADIRQQWRDWHEVTTNEDPIKRWTFRAGWLFPRDGGDRWLQADIWVTPGQLLGVVFGREPWSDSYAKGSSRYVNLTFAFLMLALSIESYCEKPR